MVSLNTWDFSRLIKKNSENRALRCLLYLSLLLHIVWGSIALFLFLGGPFGSKKPLPWQVVRDIFCPSCKDSFDAINAAAELGRLDVVSLSLTILATVLALGAFAGFFLIRSAVVYSAAEEAELVVQKQLPALVSPEIVVSAILQNDRIRLSLLNAIKSADVDEKRIDGATANDIADAFEEGEDGK